MKKYLFSVISIVFLLGSGMLCAAATEEAATMPKNNIYTEANQNLLITKGHDTFTLRLKSNPTTGYSWFLREYDNNLITPVRHSFEASDQKLMGSPSYEVWVFKMKPNAFVVPHQTMMRFVYSRPWQGNDGSNQLLFRISTSGN